MLLLLLSTWASFTAAAPAYAGIILKNNIANFPEFGPNVNITIVATTNNDVVELQFPFTPILPTTWTRTTKWHFGAAISAISAHKSEDDNMRHAIVALTNGELHELWWNSSSGPWDHMIYNGGATYVSQAVASFSPSMSYTDQRVVVSLTNSGLWEYHWTSGAGWRYLGGEQPTLLTAKWDRYPHANASPYSNRVLMMNNNIVYEFGYDDGSARSALRTVPGGNSLNALAFQPGQSSNCDDIWAIGFRYNVGPIMKQRYSSGCGGFTSYSSFAAFPPNAVKGVAAPYGDYVADPPFWVYVSSADNVVVCTANNQCSGPIGGTF